jgi:uncharacterized protein YheU (UPF0270 family)
MLEALLNELKIRNNRLFLNFRDIGSFYVDGYMHTFSAIAAERKDKQKVEVLKEKIKQIPELNKFKINDNTSMGFDSKYAAFEIVQLEAPVYFGSDNAYSIELRKQGRLEKGIVNTPLPEEFSSSHYKRTAEYQLSPVCGVFDLEDCLAEALKMQKQVNQKYDSILKMLSNDFSGNILSRAKKYLDKKIYSSFDRSINFLFPVFDNDECKKWHFNSSEEKKFSKSFGTEEVSKQLKDFTETIKSWSEKLLKISRFYIEKEDDGRFYPHFIEDITGSKIKNEERKFMRYKRMINYEEISSLVQGLFDIEKFEFNTENERIDLVVFCNRIGDEIRNCTVLSQYPLSKSEISGFKFIYAKDNEEIVRLAASLINRNDNPDEESLIITAYNINFDSINLREGGDFGIGERDSEPKKEVNLKFFEKIAVYGKNVLDPWDIAKSIASHLPNQKLEMVANFFGIDFKKGINYRNGRELSIAARTGKTEHLSKDTLAILLSKSGKSSLQEIQNLQELCTEIMVDYAASDALSLARLQNTGLFRNALKHRAYLGQKLTINPFDLMHDLNRLNYAQERSYFLNVGVHRDAVRLKFKNMLNYENRARQKIKRLKFDYSFSRGNERGVFSEVCKVYVPLTRFLEDIVKIRFPEVSDLIKYSKQFSSNPLEEADLAHAEDKLCKWLAIDFSVCMYESDKLQSLLKQAKEKSETEKSSKQFNEDIYSLFYGIRNALKEKGPFDRYLDANITIKQLEALLASDSRQYILDKYSLSAKDAQQLFNQWARLQNKERKVHGNYAVRAFHQQHAPENISSVEEALFYRNAEISKFIRQNDLKLVHCQGDYLYLQGNKEIFQKQDCQFIHVDTIEKMFVSFNSSDKHSRKNSEEKELKHKVFYLRHGYLEGFEQGEDPTYNYTQFEIKAFSVFLKHVLAEDYKAALLHVSDSLKQLKERNIPLEDLVWLNKTKKRYRAFESGDAVLFYEEKKDAEDILQGSGKTKLKHKSKMKGGKSEPQSGKAEVKYDEEKDRDYIEEQDGVVKIDGKKQPRMKKAYFMQLSSLNPDWELYEKRIHSLAYDFLEPLLGKDAKDFIESENSEQEIAEIAERIMKEKTASREYKNIKTPAQKPVQGVLFE